MPDLRIVPEFLRSAFASVPVLATISGDGRADLVREASLVADDFLVWPAAFDEVQIRVRRLLGHASRSRLETMHSRLTDTLGLRQFVGSAPALRDVIDTIPALAQVGAPVLIIGETGTGKELCARAVHACGRRRAQPFVAVDCSAIPDHLFENELFGHARGAFTDAHADRKGLAAIAHGGTLFLDEVDSLSPAAQVKLLRFLEDGSYRPLGAEHFQRADFALLAATNADLEARVRDKTFRADLFYRLNVLGLRLPPLRERRDDVEALASHFLNQFAAAHGSTPKRLTPAAVRKLQHHNWPGNVRELRNVIQRAAALASGPQIVPAHVSLPEAPDAQAEAAIGGFRRAKAQVVKDFERLYVEQLLRRHDGNVTRAARDAQQDRRAFGRLIKKHDIQRERH